MPGVESGFLNARIKNKDRKSLSKKYYLILLVWLVYTSKSIATIMQTNLSTVATLVTGKCRKWSREVAVMGWRGVT